MKQKLKLLLVCAFIMSASFLTESFRSFFGDWKCEGSGEYVIEGNNYGIHYTKCNYSGNMTNYHNPTYHWGFRHWVFFAFGMTITIMSIVEIIETKNK
jgi:hypothetical protein